MKALSAVLKINTSITMINLSGNRIGYEGVKIISETLKTNTSITGIYLSDNKIGKEGRNALVNALQYNYSIEKIDGIIVHRLIYNLLELKNRKQRIIEWMPWKNHHVCKKLEPRFHDIILTLLYLFFVSQIFLRREKRKLRQQKKI
jgi:hypothetical protein